MKSISLISVYNNVEKMREMVDSAKKQCDVNIDYVLLDNTDFKFKSAAKALNYGIKKAVGEVVVFLHQDIIFLDPNQLSLIFDFAVENKNVIFGAAGVKSKAGPPPETVQYYQACMVEKERISIILLINQQHVLH